MTYHIITIGCQMNKADSERIATYLEDNNYYPADNYQLADLVLINTCSVRQSAEDRVYGLVNQVKKKNREAKLIVAGCLANRLDVQSRLKASVDLFLPINQLPVLIELLNKKKVETAFIENRLVAGEKYLTIKAKHQSSFRAFVPIGNGCNNFCSYCVVPYARGREVYRPAKEIIEAVEQLIKQGYKEITLIAQNVNSYRQANYDFPKLLAKLAKLPGDFWLRFSSSHPKDLSNKLIAVIAENDKIANHLHLALQSGDDQILKAMNRKYRAIDFINLIKKIRQAKDNIAITTDIIVGFPGETKAQFLKTVKVFEQIKFDLAYISQYSPRPQTTAFSLVDNVPPAEKKAREETLNTVLKKIALANNRKYLKKRIKVLVVGKNKAGNFWGQTASAKKVEFKASQKESDLIGQFVYLDINQALEFILIGDYVKKSQNKKE